MGDNLGLIRCLRCKETLERSGKEPHRLICPQCNQHYMMQMNLVPVDAPRQVQLLEGIDAERGPGTE